MEERASEGRNKERGRGKGDTGEKEECERKDQEWLKKKENEALVCL